MPIVDDNVSSLQVNLVPNSIEVLPILLEYCLESRLQFVVQVRPPLVEINIRVMDWLLIFLLEFPIVLLGQFIFWVIVVYMPIIEASREVALNW
jgi:hypothetical protein